MFVKVESVVGKEFDYVIIGGGTSGLTIAARLSEDPHRSVLVLEAGKAQLDDPIILSPSLWGRHFKDARYDWGHETVPQEHCNGTQVNWARGKVLGGSSAINFMCWTRPPAEDIDEFEKLGNPGWNWNNLKEYAERSEMLVESTRDLVDQELLSKPSGFGNKGSISASFSQTLPGESLLQQTLLNLGIPRAEDPLGGDPSGICTSPNSIDPKTWTRSYAVTGYLLPANERTNLSVLVEAHVAKIVSERSEDGDIVAKLVEFEHDKKTCSVKVGKEVILSAGALKTPQILELSGIGVKSVLDKIGVPAQVVLPVGENVQEHITCGLSFELKDGVDHETADILRDPEVFARELKSHQDAPGDSLLSKLSISTMAFASLQKFSNNAEAIHESIEKEVQESKDSYPPGLYEQHEIQLARLRDSRPVCEIIIIPSFMSRPNPPKPGKKYVTLFVMLNNLFSRGTVHCSSSDFHVDPLFDPRYLEKRADLDSFVEMFKFARTAASTSPFSDIIAEEVNPGPDCVTDEQISNWLKASLGTVFHTASTASMLPRDKGGVVGPDLKVYGTNNIRVCDLSILPIHISVHPLALVYAIAERAADIIRESY